MAVFMCRTASALVASACAAALLRSPVAWRYGVRQVECRNASEEVQAECRALR